MTEQRPRLMIRQCELQSGGDIKLEYLLGSFSPNSTIFYCDNAFHDETGVCCIKRGSEKCPVYLNMIEQLVKDSTAYNLRNGTTQIPQKPRLAGPRNQQAYLSARQNQQDSV
jgi:hypothetical protein